MSNRIKHRLDDRFDLTVERCIDSPEWVWTILCDGGVLCDGYEATKRDAERKARKAYREHLHEIGE